MTTMTDVRLGRLWPMLVPALAVALTAASPAFAGADDAPAPTQLAQDEANKPEKSPEQKAAEKKLETQKSDLEAKLDKERDDFLKSKEGKAAREKVEKLRAEKDKKKKEMEKEREEFDNDPDSRSCCNPGYKSGVLRYYDEQIKKFDEDFEKERKKIADEEMKKADKKRAADADKVRNEIKSVEAELKRLREMPPLPPPGLTGYPQDGTVTIAMLPGVEFGAAGSPGSDPRVRRALLDQGAPGRVPAVTVPRVPTMSTHHPQVEVVVPPAPRPPMEVLP